MDATDEERALRGVVGDALGEQIRLRQLERDPARHHRCAVLLQPSGQLGICLAAAQAGEIRIRGEVPEVAEGGEVPERAERSGRVTGERERRGQRLGYPAMLRPERLGLPRVLQVRRAVAGLVGLDRGSEVSSGLDDGIGLGGDHRAGERRGASMR